MVANSKLSPSFTIVSPLCMKSTIANNNNIVEMVIELTLEDSVIRQRTPETLRDIVL